MPKKVSVTSCLFILILLQAPDIVPSCVCDDIRCCSAYLCYLELKRCFVDPTIILDTKQINDSLARFRRMHK